MTQLPDRAEQIRQVHAPFLRTFVELHGDAGRRGELEELLGQVEQQGWETLTLALRRVVAGARDPSLFNGLDDEDRVLLEAVLMGLQDPSTLPPPNEQTDPTLAAGGLAQMIHAAATGNAEALILIGNMADQMLKVGGSMGRLAGAIRPLINGERDLGRLAKGADERTSGLIKDVLEELKGMEAH